MITNGNSYPHSKVKDSISQEKALSSGKYFEKFLEKVNNTCHFTCKQSAWGRDENKKDSEESLKSLKSWWRCRELNPGYYGYGPLLLAQTI